MYSQIKVPSIPLLYFLLVCPNIEFSLTWSYFSVPWIWPKQSWMNVCMYVTMYLSIYVYVCLYVYPCMFESLYDVGCMYANTCVHACIMYMFVC